MYVFNSSLRGASVALICAVCLIGCVSRPTSAVLQPAPVSQREVIVDVLAVTNRDRTDPDGGFGGQWAGNLTYERYEFSIPSKRKGTVIAYPSTKPDVRCQFVVTGRQELKSEIMIEDAIQSRNFDGTVAVFVHGYNYSYQEALFRTAQMAADAKTLSPPILFSWPSAASVTGYVADRDAALSSRSELEGLLIALAKAPKVKRVVLFAHSMGGFLSMETARQLKLGGNDHVLAKLQIVLAAPDIDVDVFRSQLRDIGRMSMPITVLVTKNDRALTISSLLGGERPRVGRVDIHDPRMQEVATLERLRVIDISTLDSSDGLGHDRYAALFRFGGDLAKAEQKMQKNGGNIGAFVFDAAGAAVASPFRIAGKLSGG